jgi:hypothetical protein
VFHYSRIERASHFGCKLFSTKGRCLRRTLTQRSGPFLRCASHSAIVTAGNCGKWGLRCPGSDRSLLGPPRGLGYGRGAGPGDGPYVSERGSRSSRV